jgi:hypothetical protein
VQLEIEDRERDTVGAEHRETGNMPKRPTWLLDFRRDVYSQTGEDGIIEAILRTLPDNDRWCVEVGAWDGVYLSNTRHLIESSGYAAVLIEGDAAKFAALERNCAAYERVICRHAYVGFSPIESLDTLLATCAIPADFDLLSIDVDGNDFHIWKAMTTYRPKVVVVEFNPTIPTEVRFAQPADPALNLGSSLTALVELGEAKGYRLVAVLHYNAFFVDARYYPLFEIDDNRPQTLRTDLSSITYIFSGFDGTLFLDGHRRLPWHGIPLRESRIQHLPKRLRRYPPRYDTLAERLAVRASAGQTLPQRLWNRMRGRKRD